MATALHTATVSAVPLVAGAALWASATALLMSDALGTGHLTMQHALQPVLTAGTVCAAALAHRALAAWRVGSGVALLMLAVLGSVATVYGTLGRQAETRDTRAASATATHQRHALLSSELESARTNAATECRVRGPRCEGWEGRIDQIKGELASLHLVPVDPRGEAMGRLAVLAGLDGGKVQAIVAALDPLMLPLFLELGSIVFFAGAFPSQRRKASTVSNVDASSQESVGKLSTPGLESVRRVWSREEALQDMRRMKEVGAQRFLAARYGVAPSTISKWLAEAEHNGVVQRRRDGKCKATVAMLPAPLRRRLGHMAQIARAR